MVFDDKIDCTSSTTLSSMKKYKTKLEKIGRDLVKLKTEGGFGLPKSPISLKGILKGITITEKDFEYR